MITSDNSFASSLQATVVVLITCSLLVTSRQYIGADLHIYTFSDLQICTFSHFLICTFSSFFLRNKCPGDPIDCIVDPDVPQNVMDTYCWIHSTFSIPNRYEGRNEVSS